MEYRYVKDLAYILLVAAVIVLGVLAFNHYNGEQKVTAESAYAKQDVDANLLKQAADIESGISNRKNFTFSVEKDPLKQDIILPKKVDEIKIRLQKRRNEIRLAGVITFNEQKFVTIEHKDIEKQYAIGEVIKGTNGIKIIAANSEKQTARLSNGSTIRLKNRMNIYETNADTKDKQQNGIQFNANQNY